MADLANISGKTFLITGGASGLGAGYAEAFLKEGAKKVAILDIAEEVGKATAQRLNKSFPESTTFIKCDVSKEEDIIKAFDEVVKNFDTLDVIINNAGIMNDSPNVWRTACNVNLQGLISLTLKGLKYMRKDEGGEGGTIINISSVLAIENHEFLPIYSGCKAGVLFFSKSISIDPFFENTGVRILTMCFGPTDTPLLHNLEKLSYYDKGGELFVQKVESIPDFHYQKPESAVKGVIDMFTHGAGGSIWLVNNNKPAINITSVIDQGYNMMVKAIYDLTL